MALKFKQRGNDLKKVLIYGEDKSGKSTFAEQYCMENNLNAVVIDIDDTNYTNLPIVELNLKTDVAAYNSIKKTIAEIIMDGTFDTIIIDGVSSMLELFVSKAKGLKKYSDRAERFNDVLKDLLNSKMNLIFIGQIDMKVIHTEDFQSPKPIVKINSIVNEKYKTYHTKKGYSHKVIACRVWENSKVEPNFIKENDEPVDDVVEPVVEDDPLKLICQDIKREVELEGKLVTKSTMKSKCVKMIKAGEIEQDMRPALIKYIQKNCPEGLD